MTYNILKINEELRKTYLGEVLEKIVYTDKEEVIKEMVKKMNDEAGFKKFYAIRVTKDWRGREINTPVEE